MLLHFSITASLCASVSPSTPAGEGMLRAGVGDGASGEARHPGLLCEVGRVCCLLPRDELGAGRASQLGSQNRYFLPLPRGCLSTAAPRAPLPASQGWHPHVPHVCYTHGRCLLACLPANASPLVQTAPHPEAFASPDSVASRSDGSWVLAGVQAAKPYGTSAPTAALPIPAAAGLLGCAVGGMRCSRR